MRGSAAPVSLFCWCRVLVLWSLSGAPMPLNWIFASVFSAAPREFCVNLRCRWICELSVLLLERLLLPERCWVLPSTSGSDVATLVSSLRIAQEYVWCE